MKAHVEELEQIASDSNNRLYHYAIGLTRDEHEARDLLQQTYLYGLRGIRKGQYQDTRGTLMPWLRTIMHNVYINNCRKKGINAIPIDGLPELQAKEECRQVTEEDIGEELINAWNQIPQEQRETLLLRAQGLNHTEIALKIGISRGTTLSRSYRGRRNIIRHIIHHAQEAYPEIIPETSITRKILGESYFVT